MRIRELIRLISRLSTLHRTCYKALTESTLHMSTFTRLSCVAEHQLLSIKAMLARLNTSSDSHVYVYEAARNAAMLCLNRLFRNFSPQAPILISLGQVLRHNIGIVKYDSLADSSSISRPIRQLYLWAACVALITMLDSDYRGFSVKRCILDLEIESELELRACLEEYIWQPNEDVTCFYSFPKP